MLLTTFLLFLGRSYGYAQEHKGFSMMGIGFGAGFGEQAEDYMTSLNFSFSINKHLRSDLGFSSLHSTLWGEQIDPTGFYYGAIFKYYDRILSEQNERLMFYHAGIGIGSYNNTFIVFLNAGYERLLVEDFIIWGNGLYVYFDFKLPLYQIVFYTFEIGLRVRIDQW